MVKVLLSYRGDDGGVYYEDLELDVIPRANETVKIKYVDSDRLFTVTGVHHNITAGLNDHEVTVYADKQK